MPAVRVNGLEINYHRAGEGPPLVYTHGAAGDGREFRPQLVGLAGELTVVAWDQPGTGRSADPPAGFGLADYADTLAGLIAALDLGPAHVAGLSWGGVVVQELYRRHPELVATLILADTYAGWVGSLPPEEVEARLAHARASLDVLPEDFKVSIPGLFATAEPPSDVAALLAEIGADARPEGLRPMLDAMETADHRDLLRRIAVPTLLIWGAEDARSPVDTVARQFAEGIPGAELVVIPGAGHMANLEAPEHFNQAIRGFLGRR